MSISSNACSDKRVGSNLADFLEFQQGIPAEGSQPAMSCAWMSERPFLPCVSARSCVGHTQCETSVSSQCCVV